jgi:aquaglyceroporin related protein, other eukaryote
MVAPLLGCSLGGFLYDLLIYKGESPINTPWIGMKRVIRPNWKGIMEAIHGPPEKEV